MRKKGPFSPQIAVKMACPATRSSPRLEVNGPTIVTADTCLAGQCELAVQVSQSSRASADSELTLRLPLGINFAVEEAPL